MPTEQQIPLSEEQIAEIEARANAATKGPWESDNEQDSEHRYQYYMVLDPESRTVMDTWNSAIGEIHEEADEDGVYRWDEVARRNVAFASHAREDVPALCATVRALRQALRDHGEHESHCKSNERYPSPKCDCVLAQYLDHQGD